MDITGAILIGNTDLTAGWTFAAVDPSTGATLSPRFAEAEAADVDAACALAAEAYPVFSELDLEPRAFFLEAVAEHISAMGEPLIERAMLETGLPRARLLGERTRTVNQLRLFSRVVRQGDWIDATIDPAIPDRAPLPRPVLRRRNVAIDPCAVLLPPRDRSA